MISRTVVALFASAALVAGHGTLSDVWCDDKHYPGTKNYVAPENQKSPVRRIPTDTGFVWYNKVNTWDIACSSAGYDGTKTIAPVKAGSTVTVRWGGDLGPGNQWPHPEGPAIAYLGRCTNDDCTTTDPRNVKFFKIQEEGIDPSQRPRKEFNVNMPAGDGMWIQNKQQFDNSKFYVKVPSDIKDGQYLLRHELISLHGAHSYAEGAQYYPACIQIKVHGGGNAEPQGIPATQLYTTKDGIVDIYQPYPKGIKNYKIPGPALYKSGSSQPKPQPPAPTSKSSPPTPTSKYTSSKPTVKSCKPKKKYGKRSVVEETQELYDRALDAAQARRAHGEHMKRSSF